MDHGGEAVRPTTVESTDLGMASAVQGGEANMRTGTFHGQLAVATARRAGFQPSAAAYHNSTVFTRHVRSVPVVVFHRAPGPGGAYANICEFRRPPGPIEVVLLGLQLPNGIIPVHENYYGYSALQPRPGAGRGMVLADLLPGDARYSEVFVGLLPGGGDAAYDNYGYYALQLRSGAGHGEVLVDLLPDGAGHGEVFVDLLPDLDAVYDDYGYYPWQPRPGAGRGEVFDGLGNFAQTQQTLRGTRRADSIGGMLCDPNLGAEYDGSGALAVYDNPGTVGEHLRCLLPFAGIGACSVAVNGLAAGPGSPAVAFLLFALLLGSLFLVILHVLRV